MKMLKTIISIFLSILFLLSSLLVGAVVGMVGFLVIIEIFNRFGGSL